MRDQSNTSTFIFCLYKEFTDPSYRANLKHNIEVIQGMGLEPYIVSNHEELKEDGNLFIKLSDSCGPIQETQKFWRMHNLFFLDNSILTPLGFTSMVFEDDDYKVYTNQIGHFIGMYLRQIDTDWIHFLKTVLIPGVITRNMIYRVNINLWVPNDPV